MAQSFIRGPVRSLIGIPWPRKQAPIKHIDELTLKNSKYCRKCGTRTQKHEFAEGSQKCPKCAHVQPRHP